MNTFSSVLDNGRWIVRNGRTEVHISSDSGCLLSIQDRTTATTCCSVDTAFGQARLFRMLALCRQRRDIACDAQAQRTVHCQQNEDRLTIQYDGLCFEELTTPSYAQVRIEAGAEDELRFTLTLENRADAPIHEVQFPILSGWQNTDGKPPIELTAGAKWKSHVGHLPRFGPPAYCQWYQQTWVDYPGGSMYLPWLDFALGDTGLALTNYMERPYRGGIGGINLAGHERGNIECYWWRHYPLIKPGHSWTSPPIGIRVHDGDWHDTADRYYAWFKEQVGVSLQQPDSLRRSIGFQNIVLRNFDGTPHNAIKTLPEHAKAGKMYGVDHLAVWDALSLGNYAIHDTDVDLFDYTDDEREALREEIRAAQEAGVTVSALSDFRHINVMSDLYPRYRTEAVFAMDGSEQRENWMGGARSSKIFTPHLGGNCIILSPRSPQTRERFSELVDRYLALGYNAIFYDQPFLYQLDYNYMGDENRPDDASAACYDNAAHVRERLRQRHPEAYLIGEQFDIFSASQAIDLHMEWNFTNSGVEDLARTLFACPSALLSYVIDYTTAAESHASHAVAAGLLLCITIDGGEANLSKRPSLAAHVRCLAALRRRTAERVAYGRFRHIVGLRCDNDEGVVAYRFESPAGPAVTLAAGAEGGMARIHVNPMYLSHDTESQPARLFRLDGTEHQLPPSEELELKLIPNEAAVWYL